MVLDVRRSTMVDQRQPTLRLSSSLRTNSRSANPHQRLILAFYLVAAAILWLVLSAWVNFFFGWNSTNGVRSIDEEVPHHSNERVSEAPPALSERKSVSSTVSLSLGTNFSGVLARAFEPWPTEKPLPCFPPGDPWDDSTPIDTGFMFPKPIKCGGSTVAGILLRLARNVARRQSKQSNNAKSFDTCRLRGFQHAKAYKYFANRTRDKSFLFSILREPTSRAVSHFFHLIVSRENVQPTDANFRKAIRKDEIYAQDYLLEAHALKRFFPGGDDAVGVANQIVDDYDFLGITERMDESVVVLQLLLGLTTGDVLYLDAKTNGGFDDGGYKNRCFFIVPKYVSPGMKKYFASEAWQALVRWDTALYHAANRSLDLTIDSMGRHRFATELAKFRWAKQVVAERCDPVARFPCSPGGEKQDHNCLHLDSGCAYECIDQVVAKLKL